MHSISSDLLELARRQGIDREAMREHLRVAQEEDREASRLRGEERQQRMFEAACEGADGLCGESRR